MKAHFQNKIMIILAFILSACAFPSFSAVTPAAVADPLLLGTPIAQTAAAAGTQTAQFSPPTLTPTLTPFPTGTLITVPTQPTFMFALPTFTPLPSITPTQGPISVGGGGSGGEAGDPQKIFTDHEWTCAIRGKNPPMGTKVKPGAVIYFSVLLFNNGTRVWPNDSVDFRYKSGFRPEGKPIQDLPKTIEPGQEVSLSVNITAPKKPDTYNTIWTLKVGRTEFCGVKYTFIVQ